MSMSENIRIKIKLAECRNDRVLGLFLLMVIQNELFARTSKFLRHGRRLVVPPERIEHITLTVARKNDIGTTVQEMA